ncbi:MULTISPECIES: hypothetical protein [Streptomyces]|uniref:hypothetical protein n=1 Tax=Streptomyces TaxID=1883 RepID=UPI001EE67514|nr:MULTISPECIES: hypothetical protein [Streptomyces]
MPSTSHSSPPTGGRRAEQGGEARREVGGDPVHGGVRGGEQPGQLLHGEVVR